MSRISFPRDFLFGAATASYQIEGAWNEDGKGESIWDRFAHTPGKIERGETGDVACDHYHRHKEDVRLMQEIGLDAYRFSIAWTRIFPQGKGKVNRKGIDFYNRLVDELLDANITPFVTLFHWDFPQYLMEKCNGWLGRDSAQYFADYADVVFRSLGDRVKHWITHNEPRNVHILGGYTHGSIAPGLKLGMKENLLASHHMLLAHGLAVRAFRDSNMGGSIGITLALEPPIPLHETDEDMQITEAALQDRLFWMADPIFKGAYPPIVDDERVGEIMPPNWRNDMPVISAHCDFLGVNSYRRFWVETDPRQYLGIGYRFDYCPLHVEKTTLGWPVTPEGMYDILSILGKRYKDVPLYVTENGYGDVDNPDPKRNINDTFRVSFLEGYLANVKRAMDNGVPVKGYFAWSLMDNFEWAGGFRPRFGIVYVDYRSQERVWKESAKWYKRMISERGFELRD
jgi:beta-glucosidase